MQKISVEMPLVKRCDAAKCGFNVNSSCHAKAITVGDNTNPACDTFMDSVMHAQENKRIAGVGACKVSGCKYNNDYECFAEGITVGVVDEKVKCQTYLPKT